MIPNFHHVLNVVCFLLGNSPVSEFYIKINFRWLGLENINWNGLRMASKRVTFLNSVTNISVSWFQTFIMFWMLCAFFWVIPRRLNFICWRFGTLCLFHLHRQAGNSDAGELPRRKPTTYQFHIEKILDQHTNYQLCHVTLQPHCILCCSQLPHLLQQCFNNSFFFFSF